MYLVDISLRTFTMINISVNCIRPFVKLLSFSMSTPPTVPNIFFYKRSLKKTLNKKSELVGVRPKRWTLWIGKKIHFKASDICFVLSRSVVELETNFLPPPYVSRNPSFQSLRKSLLASSVAKNSNYVGGTEHGGTIFIGYLFCFDYNSMFIKWPIRANNSFIHTINNYVQKSISKKITKPIFNKVGIILTFWTMKEIQHWKKLLKKKNGKPQQIIFKWFKIRIILLEIDF